MRLETELQALRAFSPGIRAELPFHVPHIAGSVRRGDLSTFVYSHLEGSTWDLESLCAGGRRMASELGRALAAIHELPPTLVHRADLPSYEANEFRQRKLNELDQAATSGHIPSTLLRRWEHALEDVTLWKFSPTVVHGDLHEDNLLISGGRVSAVTGWTDLRIGDPADDFAWLAAAEDPDFADAVYAAYAATRTTPVDPHLARRASLAAEFALAQWMVRGLAVNDTGMIAEAEDMMATLVEDIHASEQAHAEEAKREWAERNNRADSDTDRDNHADTDSNNDDDSDDGANDDSSADTLSTVTPIRPGTGEPPSGEGTATSALPVISTGR